MPHFYPTGTHQAITSGSHPAIMAGTDEAIMPGHISRSRVAHTPRLRLAHTHPTMAGPHEAAMDGTHERSCLAQYSTVSDRIAACADEIAIGVIAREERVEVVEDVGFRFGRDTGLLNVDFLGGKT